MREEPERARAAVARLRSQWRPTVLDMFAIGAFLALTVFVLVRGSGRPAQTSAPPAETRTVRITSRSAPLHRTRSSPAAALVSRAQTPVLVLNGNGISGAAASTAQIVRARGYPITAAANAPQQDYPRSVAMYKQRFAREAARLARDLNVATVEPLNRFSVLRGTPARLVLIVGGGHD